MNEHIPVLSDNWRKEIERDFSNASFVELLNTVQQEYNSCTVYPPRDQIFRALCEVDYSAVRVCILGQDPYHGPGQANGMAFAVCEGEKCPPSLMNIFKELGTDIGFSGSPKTTLLGWAKQGVLLLNTVLTVRDGEPQSHAELGWQRFTDAVISALSRRTTPLVFVLWGASAGAKRALIAPHHGVIESPHPSPLSASRGFFGSKPFSRVNEFLRSYGSEQIDWSDTGGVGRGYYATADKIKRI